MIILTLIDSRLNCYYNIKFTINLISDYYKLPTVLARFMNKNFKWLISIKLYYHKPGIIWLFYKLLDYTGYIILVRGQN